jgi:Ca2+-binding EF-hand superfamily protein
MLSINTEAQLAELLATIAEGEQQVEAGRLALCEHYNFDVYSTFRTLDRLGLNNLSSLDIKSWLDRANVFCSEQEAFLVIRQYDANSDGRLSMQEFFQLVLPATASSMRQLVIERPTQALTLEVEFSLNRLLEKEVALQRDLEYARRALRLKPDFELAVAFRSVDALNLNFIDREQLQAFLRRNGIASYPAALDAIMRRLDNDGDGKLSYLEFVEATLTADARTTRGSTAEVQRPTSPLSSSFRPTLSASPYRGSSSYLAGSPYRSSLRSPLRSSLRSSQPMRTSYLRESYPSRVSLRMSSPLRDTPLRDSYSARLSSPLRSSLLRTSSPRLVHSIYSPEKSRLDSSWQPRSSLRSSLAYSSSLRAADQIELVSAFKEQIDLARDLDSAKNDLALRSDFNLDDAFRMFDLEDKGYVSIAEFEETLESFHLPPLRDEVSLLVKHYSRIGDTRLLMSDFSTLLMPQGHEYARMIRSRLPYNSSVRERRRVFTYETTERLLRVLRLSLEAERVAESLRQRLSRLPTFNLYDAFQAVDSGRDGFITLDEFREILGRHGVFATTKDLESLMDRYDKNRDGMVSYSEFVQEVTPKSPRKY